MLKLSAEVKSIVLIDGIKRGIAHNQQDLVEILQEYMPEGATESWLEGRVSVYPLLSEEPLNLAYNIERDYDVEFDEGIEDDGTFTIDEHYGREWDSLDEIEEYVKDAVKSGDYSMSDVESWTITKTVSSEIDISFDLSELEITVDSYPETVAEFIEEEEPEFVDEPEENDKPLPSPTVEHATHDLRYVSPESARQRIRDGVPVYVMDVMGRGKIILYYHDVESAVEQNLTFAKIAE